MSKRAFRLAYDGRSFRGFQRQPDVRTVEDTLLAGLRELDVLEAGEATPGGYAAAGRTDAGVSAVAQTVAFACPDWCTPRALNGALPEAIRAWASADVPADFHATHDADRREYTYVLPAPTGDLESARAAAERLSGEHDFHNLTPDDRGTVRALSVGIDRAGEFLVLTVASDGFPRQLVRRLASVVDGVATGESSREALDRVLSAEVLDGADGIPPAPAEGLVLTGVEYPDVGFAVDERALADARAVFEGRAWAARTEAEALRRVVDGLGGR